MPGRAQNSGFLQRSFYFTTVSTLAESERHAAESTTITVSLRIAIESVAVVSVDFVSAELQDVRLKAKVAKSVSANA